jgi:hypothetical protein
VGRESNELPDNQKSESALESVDGQYTKNLDPSNLSTSFSLKIYMTSHGQMFRLVTQIVILIGNT